MKLRFRHENLDPTSPVRGDVWRTLAMAAGTTFAVGSPGIWRQCKEKELTSDVTLRYGSLHLIILSMSSGLWDEEQLAFRSVCRAGDSDVASPGCANHKNLPDQECEPLGHGIGRSCGGLTTKIHHAVDGKGRPLAVVATGGQRHDGVILPQVLADIRVPRAGGGRPRVRMLSWPTVLTDPGPIVSVCARVAFGRSFRKRRTRSRLERSAAAKVGVRRHSTPSRIATATS